MVRNPRSILTEGNFFLAAFGSQETDWSFRLLHCALEFPFFPPGYARSMPLGGVS